jgi:hypothetical protein
MPDHSILVRHILHLTDARYFAAVGVDYMSLVLDDSQLSFDRWHAIKDWVEGVALVAEPSHDGESLLAKIIIDAKPDGILVNPSNLPDVPANLELFMLASDGIHPSAPLAVSLIAEVPAEIIEAGYPLPEKEESFFLQTEWTPFLVAKVLEQGYTGGFCFTGGQEEITGVRDYQMMDDMISLIK